MTAIISLRSLVVDVLVVFLVDGEVGQVRVLGSFAEG